MSREARCSECDYRWKPRSIGAPLRCPACGVRFRSVKGEPAVSVSSSGSPLAGCLLLLAIGVGILVWRGTRPEAAPAAPDVPVAVKPSDKAEPVPSATPPAPKGDSPTTPAPAPKTPAPPPKKDTPMPDGPLRAGEVVQATRADEGAVKDAYLYLDDQTYQDTNTERQHRQAVADKKALLLAPGTKVKITATRYLSCAVELVQPAGGWTRGVMNAANLCR